MGILSETASESVPQAFAPEAIANPGNDDNYADIDNYDHIGQIPQTTGTFGHPTEHGPGGETSSPENTVNDQQNTAEQNGNKPFYLSVNYL